MTQPTLWRSSTTVVDWLAKHEGWDGDRYCRACRQPLLMDIQPEGFDEATGDPLHRRKGVCPRAGWLNLGGHTRSGIIVSPPPKRVAWSPVMASSVLYGSRRARSGVRSWK